MTADRQTGEGQPFAREMTVARVRERIGVAWADVAFLESAQVFRLSKRHTHYHALLAKLRDAQVARGRVRVILASATSDVIEDIG
ncbi:MAG TPA: hypothetical protein VH762_06585 [Gemmatimonadaceae bacterium]